MKTANEIMNTVSVNYFDDDGTYYHGFLNGMLQGNTVSTFVSDEESGASRLGIAVSHAYIKNKEGFLN